MDHDHGGMGHGGMDHGGMDHGGMNHGGMNHGGMNHGGMNHGGMNHGGMNHGGMDHGGMDHGDMDHSGDHGDMDHSGGHGGHMMMYFHSGVNETILFEWWKTTTPDELCVAVFIVGVMALLYEGIKYSRESLLRSSLSRRSSITPGSTTALHGRPTEPGCMNLMFTCTHLVQTFFHAVQFTISYMLMLVFMTYNVYLCMGVVAGATIGFFLFGWRSNSLTSVTEHCD